MAQPLRVLFAGSPDIAVPALKAVVAAAQLVGVLTNPESQKGRGGGDATGTPVARATALLPGPAVPVLAFEHLGPQSREAVLALAPDLLVSFAYGRIFGPKFLALFPYGGLNVHPSLLPRWRGPTPIPAAILHRDAESGVSVQRIAVAADLGAADLGAAPPGSGIDSGDILAFERIPLGGRETCASLSETASEVGARLLAKVLADLAAGRELARPQEGEVTSSRLLHKDDGLIDWSAGVLDIDAMVRAYDPWPGAFTWLRGQRLAILEALAMPGATWPVAAGLEPAAAGPEPAAAGLKPVAAGLKPAAAGPGLQPRPGTILGLDKSCGLVVQGTDGLMALRRLQLQQRKALAWKEFANGVRDLPGTAFSPGPEPRA